MEFLGIPTTEWIGYIATVILLSSFTMKTLKFLRIVNSIACMLFIVYGLKISSTPVILSNAAIFGINLYYLILKKKK
jgi:hypothetical protein